MDLKQALGRLLVSGGRWPLRLTAALLITQASLTPSIAPAAFFPNDPGEEKPPLPTAPTPPPIGARAPANNGPNPGPLFFIPTPTLALPPDDPPSETPEPASLVSGLLGSCLAALYAGQRRRRTEK